VPERVVQLGGDPATLVQPGPLGDVPLFAFELPHPLPLGLDEERLLTAVLPGEPGQHNGENEDGQDRRHLGGIHDRDGRCADNPDPGENLPVAVAVPPVKVGEHREHEVRADPPDRHAVVDVQPTDQPEDGEHPRLTEPTLAG